MDMKTVRRQARERMGAACRVCPQCDGRACAGELPGMGGIRSGASFRANITALEQHRLKMRVIHDIPGVEHIDMACAVLGHELAMPVLIAPLAGAKFNMGGALSEERFAAVITTGAKQAGIIACTGDGTDEGFHSGLAAVGAVGGWGIPVIKPWLGERFFERVEQAARTGCKAVGMDIDTAAFSSLGKGKNPVGPRSREDLGAVVERIHGMGLKFLLKGVLSVEDAQAAAACGCDAIVVSNHGGRALEALPGTAEVLPMVAREARQMEVLVDGGVRSGADVVKMLALGAKAVLVGRPAVIAAMGGEEEGMAVWLRQLRRQVTEALLLTGCADVRDAGPHMLV